MQHNQYVAGMPSELRSASKNRKEKNESKRGLSPDNQKSSPSTKKVKGGIMSAEFEELKKIMKSSCGAIEEKIELSQKSLQDGMQSLATKLNDEISSFKTSVNEFHSKIGAEIVEIKSQVNEHATRIENNEDDIERIRLSYDLRLVGIPVHNDENLHALFLRLATIIGFVIDEHTNTSTIERMNMRNKTTNQLMPSETILIHFAVLRQKQIFYSHYLNKMPLSPTEFGFNEDKRIILDAEKCSAIQNCANHEKRKKNSPNVHRRRFDSHKTN